MTPRRRSKKHKGLEPNLYFNISNGYYSYRHPISGKYHGMGTNKAKAQAAARQLNARLMPAQDLVAEVMGTAHKTIKDACELFIRDRVKENPKLAESSKQAKIYRIERIDGDLGHREIEHFGTRDVADWLEAFKGDSYKQHRSVLSQLFEFAQTKGWVDRNPVTPTVAHDINYKKERQRLSLEQFEQIYAAADPWFQVAMDLALLTCQGRNEISKMQYSQIRDGILYVVRQKTYRKTETAYIAIEITEQLQAVIDRSLNLSPKGSPFIVHRRPVRTTTETKHSDWSVKPDYLSREFSKLRETVSSIKKMPDSSKPTFHEIRSLGAHLIEKSGATKAEVQALMGHADESMTDHYLAGHEQKWITAKAATIERKTLH